ncbi:MAG: SoxR reducing system RseC family protein [Spirochaetales bacterium]|nr:SoxR reducing system RseC family protein [Candidatus Physcosoma equi]
MKQTVTVIERKPESYIVGCDKSACNGCHNELFCRNKDNTFEVMNPEKVELKEGDQTEIEIPEKKTILSIFLSLGFPLLMFLPGYFVGKAFTQNEILLFVWGVGGMALGFLLSGCFFRIYRKQFSPVIAKDDEY